MPAPCPFCFNTDTAEHPGYRQVPPAEIVAAEGVSDSYDFSRCPQCGTSYLDPMPGHEELGAFYDDAYYGEGDAKFVGPVERVSRLLRTLRAKRVARFVPAGGRILDVGCGRAVMLGSLMKRGYDVAGVELDTTAAKRARKSIGNRVHHTVQEAVDADERRFDAVTFWHSLEHFTNPGETFDAAVAALRPGGLIVLSLPNFGSAQAKMCGHHWLHLDVPRHVIHFDMGRLADHLTRRGFTVEKFDHFCQEFNVIDSLCLLYARLGFHPLFPFELIRNAGGDAAGPWWKKLLGLALGPVLLPVAAVLSNVQSLGGDGATSTLYLRTPHQDAHRSGK